MVEQLYGSQPGGHIFGHVEPAWSLFLRRSWETFAPPLTREWAIYRHRVNNNIALRNMAETRALTTDSPLARPFAKFPPSPCVCRRTSLVGLQSPVRRDAVWRNVSGKIHPRSSMWRGRSSRRGCPGILEVVAMISVRQERRGLTWFRPVPIHHPASPRSGNLFVQALATQGGFDFLACLSCGVEREGNLEFAPR